MRFCLWRCLQWLLMMHVVVEESGFVFEVDVGEKWFGGCGKGILYELPCDVYGKY